MSSASFLITPSQMASESALSEAILSGAWGGQTGFVLEEIESALVLAGYRDDNFSAQIWGYQAAVQEGDFITQAKMLRLMALGVPRYYKAILPQLALRNFGTKRFGAPEEVRKNLLTLFLPHSAGSTQVRVDSRGVPIRENPQRGMMAVGSALAHDGRDTLPPDEELARIMGDVGGTTYSVRLRLLYWRAKKALANYFTQLELLKDCEGNIPNHARALEARLTDLANTEKLQNRLPEKLAEILNIEETIETLMTEHNNRKRKPPTPFQQRSPKKNKPATTGSEIPRPAELSYLPVREIVKELFDTSRLPADFQTGQTTNAKWEKVEQRSRQMLGAKYYRQRVFWDSAIRWGRIHHYWTPEEAWAFLDRYERALPTGKTGRLNRAFGVVMRYRTFVTRGTQLIEDVNKILPGMRDNTSISWLLRQLQSAIATERAHDIKMAIRRLESALKNLEERTVVLAEGHWKFRR